MERPSPYLLIKTPSRSIDEVAILEELERLRNFQRFNYDDDLAALVSVLLLCTSSLRRALMSSGCSEP